MVNESDDIRSADSQLALRVKCNTDPLFEEKATRIMALSRTRPADGVVVCFDE